MTTHYIGVRYLDSDDTVTETLPYSFTTESAARQYIDTSNHSLMSMTHG